MMIRCFSVLIKSNCTILPNEGSLLVFCFRCFGFLHVFWAACLMTLVVLGLLEFPWNGVYVGGDLLWMAVLFFCTGVLGSTNLRFANPNPGKRISLNKTTNRIYLSHSFSRFYFNHSFSSNFSNKDELVSQLLKEKKQKRN